MEDQSNVEDIGRIVAAGEGYTVDFKKAPNKDIAKDACAFANASGGRIFIGITDDGRIVGTDTSNRARSKILDAINNIDPRPKVSIDVFDNLIVVNVPEGKDKPYMCANGFYLRIGPNSQKLDREGIYEFMIDEGLIIYDTMIRDGYFVKDNFDEKAYKKFIRKAMINSDLPHEQVLQTIKCAVLNKDGELIYTNAGALFFRDNNKDNHFCHADVVCVLFKGLDKYKALDVKRFNGGMLDNIDDAMTFLQKHLNLRYEFGGGAQRKEILELPEDALREAIINSICHRDYFKQGANVMIEIYDDRVVIRNPGGLPKGVTLDDLGNISVIRNKVIADLLVRADYIEKLGSGVRKMRGEMAKVGLEPPVFESDYFFTATFKRPPKYTPADIVSGEASLKLPSGLSENEIKVCELIHKNNGITLSEMAEQLGCGKTQAHRVTESLIEKGIMVRAGPQKGGSWKFK